MLKVKIGARMVVESSWSWRSCLQRLVTAL
jgi:hypothetical protein